MSEINSIANGTFTIGQTSATNFQAGPGISITQPSEGVVRIGNDETVLWSGAPVNSTSGNYITLTENASGFESIKVVAGHSDLTWSTISEFPGAANRWEFERISNDTTTYSIIDVAGLYRDSTDSLKWVSRGGSRMQFNSNGTMGYQTSLTSMCVHKVIGINRIGGNE